MVLVKSLYKLRYFEEYNSIMDYLENWIGLVRNLYYFNENDKEITSQLRLYQSKYDWIGTRQTLVCNKAWLKSIRDKLSGLETHLELLHKEVIQANEMAHPLLNSSINQKLTDSWGDLDESTKSTNSSKKTQLEPKSMIKNILIQLKQIGSILDNITRYTTSNRSEVLNYFFSEDLYECENTYEIKCQHGFLHDLVDYCKWLERAEVIASPVTANDQQRDEDFTKCAAFASRQLSAIPEIAEQLKATILVVKEIYTVENLDKIYQTAIMFGFIPPQLESKNADKFKIEKYFDQLSDFI